MVFLEQNRVSIEAHYSVLANAVYVVKDIFRNYKQLFFMLIIGGILSVITPVLGIYLPKFAVDLVTKGKGNNSTLISMVVFIFVLTVCLALQGSINNGNYQNLINMNWHYLRELFYKSLDCDYSLIESAKGQTQYQKARRSVDGGAFAGPYIMVSSIQGLFVGIASFFLYSGIVATCNPLIILLIVTLSSANYFALRHAQSYEQNRKVELAKLENKLDYIQNISDEVKAAKDVRIYSLPGWFTFAHDETLNAYARLRNDVQNRHYMAFLINAVTLLLRDGVAYAYLIWCAAQGKITIGNFVLYFGIIDGLSSLVSRIVENVSSLIGASMKMNDVRIFLENSNEQEPENPEEVPKLMNGALIEFKDVCYSYDGEKNVLNHFNLKINEGESLALVGVNSKGYK